MYKLVFCSLAVQVILGLETSYFCVLSTLLQTFCVFVEVVIDVSLLLYSYDAVTVTLLLFVLFLFSSSYCV